MTKELGDVQRCLGRNTAFALALVSTKTNVLTVAMVHYFAFDPPTVGVGIHKDRFSHDLLRAEGCYVINLPTNRDAALLNACGALSGRDGDKFEAIGLTAVPATQIDSSLIDECPVNIECRVMREIDVGERTWFLAEVVAVHEAEDWDPARAMIYGGGCFRAVGPVVGRRGG
jgi:flavin reductase (DIM6/NTAB) family NADH-FMN oxidoreductase RutF